VDLSSELGLCCHSIAKDEGAAVKGPARFSVNWMDRTNSDGASTRLANTILTVAENKLKFKEGRSAKGEGSGLKRQHSLRDLRTFERSRLEAAVLEVSSQGAEMIFGTVAGDGRKSHSENSSARN